MTLRALCLLYGSAFSRRGVEVVWGLSLISYSMRLGNDVISIFGGPSVQDVLFRLSGVWLLVGGTMEW